MSWQWTAVSCLCCGLVGIAWRRSTVECCGFFTECCDCCAAIFRTRQLRVVQCCRTQVTQPLQLWLRRPAWTGTLLNVQLGASRWVAVRYKRQCLPTSPRGHFQCCCHEHEQWTMNMHTSVKPTIYVDPLCAPAPSRPPPLSSARRRLSLRNVCY